MFILNRSSYPDGIVFRVVRYAFRGMPAGQVGILVKDARGENSDHGYTSPGMPSTAPHAWRKDLKRFVSLSIGKMSAFPADNLRMAATRKRFIPFSAVQGNESVYDVIGPNEQVWLTDFSKRRWKVMTPELRPYGGLKSVQIEMQDWVEGLVALAAHEAWHVWQFEKNDRQRDAGIPKRKRHGFSEAEAERHAARILESFRRERESVLASPLRLTEHRSSDERHDILYGLARLLSLPKEMR